MPVVLVHGVPDTQRVWEPLRARLRRTDVLAPSLPGFGTPRPRGFAGTKEEYASWLTGELDAIGEPVDLVGHDWGASLVMRVASQRPDLIRTWACGSAAIDVEYEWHPTAQLWQTEGAGEEMMAAGMQLPEADRVAMLEGAGMPRELAEIETPSFDETMADCILRLYRSGVRVGEEWQPDIEALGSARPALILSSADPFLDSRFPERLAARVGGALMTFDCGHWWPWERAAEVAAGLEQLWGDNA